MSKMHDMREMLCRELDELAKSGTLKLSDLDVIDKLTHSIKSIDTIEAMEGGYSGENGRGYPKSYSRNYPMSYDEGYSGRRYARRDSMGRFSRDDGYSEDDDYSRHDYGGSRDQMTGKLRRMLGDAPDEKTRNAIMTALNTIEK